MALDEGKITGEAQENVSHYTHLQSYDGCEMKLKLRGAVINIVVTFCHFTFDLLI